MTLLRPLLLGTATGTLPVVRWVPERISGFLELSKNNLRELFITLA
jgi:hypothetical protein